MTAGTLSLLSGPRTRDPVAHEVVNFLVLDIGRVRDSENHQGASGESDEWVSLRCYQATQRLDPVAQPTLRSVPFF